jgi:hypothetical protein
MASTVTTDKPLELASDVINNFLTCAYYCLNESTEPLSLARFVTLRRRPDRLRACRLDRRLKIAASILLPALCRPCTWEAAYRVATTGS